jgi:hypothetical protein
MTRNPPLEELIGLITASLSDHFVTALENPADQYLPADKRKREKGTRQIKGGKMEKG